MAIFGLITEGITDQIVLENILCGFYKDYEELDQEIRPLEPPRDETDMKQGYSEFGTGWSAIFNYLPEKRFRDDVLNNDFVIIQIDTDIAEGFDCSKSQPITVIIDCVIQKIINTINSSTFSNISTFSWKTDHTPTLLDYQSILFYTRYSHKIIFAISVHSLECWILPIYDNSKNEKIINCENKLKTAASKKVKKLKIEKSYKSYDSLSQEFLRNKQLVKFISKNTSFKYFINQLPNQLN